MANVPSHDQVGDVVEQVTAIWERDLGVTTAREAANQLDWTIEVRQLLTPSSKIRSLLFAEPTGGFSIVINAQHRPSVNRQEWLIAHEFAHSLFFSPHYPPRRIISHSEEEEAFCDAFANMAIRQRALRAAS